MDGDFFDRQKEKDVESIKLSQGEMRKFIQPTFLQDPKLKKLKEALVDWINSTLKAEHIVVQSLEEDLYDGLVLHHLLGTLANVHLSVEEIALSSAAQINKLEVILEELNNQLKLKDNTFIKWNVKLIHNKDLLATIHLLVAMVRCFQPDLDLPPNVKVEVLQVEVTKSGINSDKQIEFLTEESDSNADSLGHSDAYPGEDPIKQLLELDSHRVNTVKKAILHFVNQNMATIGVQVTDMDKQFADGVILLLLIGQLEGFYVPLYDFHLTPVSYSEMIQNVTLALDLLLDLRLVVSDVDPQDIVSEDVSATLKVLYALFKKHKDK